MSNTKCYSPLSLKAELEVVRRKLTLRETWETVEQGIVQLTDCCNNGGCEFATEMLTSIHSLSRPLNRAINSDRSSLSGSAIELVTALSAGLGSSFAPLVSHFLPSLLGICARTNKVFTRRSKHCVFALIKDTKSSSILPLLAEALNHKSASVRSLAAEGVLAYLACFNPRDIVNDSRAHLLEDVIKLTARDASADVRQVGKKIFDAYKARLPDRVESFIVPLSPTTKKHLAVQGTTAPHSTPRVLSRGHPAAERARPQKITSSKHSDRRAHPLSSERTRLQQQTSRTSRKTVVASQSDQKTEGQKKPVSGGRPTNKSPEAVVNVFSIAAELCAGTSKPAASREPPVQATTPHITHVSVDISHLCIDPTASPHDIQDSKTALSSIQGGYLCTPSHIQRDVSRPSDRLQRAPRRRRISIYMERSQPPRDCTTATPLSCDRPMRPLISCIQRRSPLTPLPHDVRVHIPQDVSHSSSVNVEPQEEGLWRARGAKFAVFTGPDPEDIGSNCPTHMTDGLRAALQYPPRHTVILHPQRHRVACPKEFKFSSVLPLSPLREAAPVSVTTPCHLRQVLNFLDIAI